MRTNSTDVTQTTCDYQDGAYWCDAYAITGHAHAGADGTQAARHHARLQARGWTDLEGRDYCPDHKPTP